ncbi:LOW QUALITY PROTEIN: hypothetical protein HID58_056438, partial [Brassica napus]
MSPKTRLAEKNNKEDALEKKKNESMAKKKKAAAEKKKAVREKKKDSARKKKETSKERGREKKRDAAKKNTETETAEKKRKRNSGVDGGSLSNPTKRARNTASPPEQEHQGDHSPAPSAELPSQADVEGTTGLAHPSEPQKSPTQAPNNHDEEIVSNNRDSHTPEAAIDHTAQRTEAEDMAVNPLRPNEFFFKPQDYRKSCNEDEEDEDDGKEAEHDDDNGEKDDTEKEHEDEEAEDDGNEHEDEDNDEKDDTEKDHDEEAEDDGNEHENEGKEPEKELEVQPEKEATGNLLCCEFGALTLQIDDAEDDGKEPQKELEVQPEKEATGNLLHCEFGALTLQIGLVCSDIVVDDAEEYTLRVMEAAAEKVVAEAARKEAMTRPKRVLKPSHLQKSPFVKKEDL